MNAVITGATKGVGKAIALKLAEAGYNVAICSRNQSELDNLCQQIRSQFGVQAIGIETDCSDSTHLNRFATFVQQHFARVDVLVNNAGIFIPATILDEPEDTLSKQMAVNLYSAHFLIRFFGRKMRESKSGHIVNICSIASIKPFATSGSYTVTKFALLGLTRVLREELMPHNVKVTAILPGSTLTGSWEGTSLPESRFVTSDDVAKAVLTCVSLSVGANIDELIVRPLGGEV